MHHSNISGVKGPFGTSDTGKSYTQDSHGFALEPRGHVKDNGVEGIFGEGGFVLR